VRVHEDRRARLYVIHSISALMMTSLLSPYYRLVLRRNSASLYLHPVRQIQKMSQPPKVLSTEDLNTTDAKYVPDSVNISAHLESFPLKMGELEKNKLAGPKGQACKEVSGRVLSSTGHSLPFLFDRGSGRLRLDARVATLA
jgi:hypothetical protein